MYTSALTEITNFMSHPMQSPLNAFSVHSLCVINSRQVCKSIFAISKLFCCLPESPLTLCWNIQMVIIKTVKISPVRGTYVKHLSLPIMPHRFVTNTLQLYFMYHGFLTPLGAVVSYPSGKPTFITVLFLLNPKGIHLSTAPPMWLYNQK